MAHHPTLLLGYGMFELAFERSNLLDKRLKNLAVLKAATMVGCGFCIDFGSALSRAEGVTEGQLREVPDFERSEAFSLLEKLVLRYAAAATRTVADVPEGLFGALREHFSEAQLVELTAAVALENYRARFNHAFGMGAQGFSEGFYCAVPETSTITTGAGGRASSRTSPRPSRRIRGSLWRSNHPTKDGKEDDRAPIADSRAPPCEAIVITGASMGIGRACALSLDALVFRLFAGVRKAEDGESLRRASSARLTPIGFREGCSRKLPDLAHRHETTSFWVLNVRVLPWHVARAGRR